MSPVDDTQRAAICEQCRNLVVALGFHGDHRDPASAVALFAVDGSWLRGGRNYVGREEIAGSYAHGSPTAVTRHINASPMITVIDEEHAEGKSYYLAVQDNPGDPDAKPPFALRLFSMGEYHDTFVRTPEGWRIATRATVRIFQGG